MKNCHILLASVGLFLSVFDVQAATVQPLSLAKIIETAELIAVGECVEKRGRWQGKRIVTDNIIRVTQTIKGNISDLVITTIGGEAMHPGLKSTVRMAAPGAARFQVGEQVLVFTVANSKGQQQVVGLSQGKFDVTTDPDTGEAVIAVGQKTLVKETASFNFDAAYSLSASFDADPTVLKPKQMTLSGFVDKLNQELASQAQGGAYD